MNTKLSLMQKDITKLNSNTWLFTYKQEEFIIKQDDTKSVFNFMVYNNNLPDLNGGSLKSCLFMIKRMMKNKECLSIMSLANNHNLLDGFSYEFDSSYKKTKSYKNYKLTK
tara:strand:+ start:81 stop:413 length:333 start_codon:yes stop_codon:yes gene_type:complete